MIRIEESRLGKLTPLGKGGMADVYRVGNPIPEVPGPLAYKKLHLDPTNPDRAPMLDAMRNAIALRDAMTPAEQDDLDEVTVWPRALVVDGTSEDVGTLMSLIPGNFMLDANGGPRMFEFQLLCAGTAQAKANGYDQSRKPADKPLVRLALMANLAHAIEVIHRTRGGRNLVYGDISLRNAVVAINPPRILLLDCDGVADVANPARVQPNTIFFKPPEILNKQQKQQDQATDVYKLALCIIRGLAIGNGSTQLSDPQSPSIPAGLLDQAGVDLLNRALSLDRGARPTAEDLKDYLVGRVLDLAEPPSLLSAELSTYVTLRGSEVFVRWTHKGAKTVRIYSDVLNFNLEGIDADAYPNGYPIQPPTACEIWVSVANDEGEDAGPAGRLHYFEMPPVQISVNPPSVVLADLPALQLPRMRAELPPYPVFPTDAVPLPPLQMPAVPPLTVMALASQAPLVRQLWNGIGHAYHAADGRIDAEIRPVLRRLAKKLRAEAENTASTTTSS
jgi:serine/threonine protein kinase